MIRKFDRYHSTVVGNESSSVTKKLLRMDPKVCTIFGTADALKLIFGFFTGLMPFMTFDRDLAALPYMTRDYIKMKFEERRQATTLGKKAFYTFYIYMNQLCNIVFNPVLENLRKRGIYTAYWVLNMEGEVEHLLRTSKVQGIMTDRPAKLKVLFSELRHKKVD